MEKLLAGLSVVIAHCATAMAILMTGLVTLSVVMRYLLGSPFIFTDELVGLLCVSLAFAALPHALSQNRHIRIPLLVEKMPRNFQTIGWLVSQLIFLTFWGVFLKEIWRAADFALRFNARADISGLPVFPWVVGTGIPVFLMLMIVAIRLVTRSERREG